VVGELVDVNWLVVGLAVWIVLAVVQVESDVEVVDDLQVAVDGDVEAVFFEYLDDFFSDSVGCGARCGLDGCESVRSQTSAPS